MYNPGAQHLVMKFEAEQVDIDHDNPPMRTIHDYVLEHDETYEEGVSYVAGTRVLDPETMNVYKAEIGIDDAEGETMQDHLRQFASHWRRMEKARGVKQIRVVREVPDTRPKFDVYFPRRHAIRVTKDEFLRCGFNRMPGIVDERTGDEMPVATPRSLKHRAA